MIEKPGKKKKRRPPNRLSPSALRRLHKKIWDEVGPTCEDCGRGLVWPVVVWHHVIFKSHGGGDTRENLRQVCSTEKPSGEMSCHDKYHRGGKG